MVIAKIAKPPTAPPAIAPMGLDRATGAKAAGCWQAAVVVDDFHVVDVVIDDIVVKSDPDVVTANDEVDVVAKTELDLGVGLLTVKIELAG